MLILVLSYFWKLYDLKDPTDVGLEKKTFSCVFSILLPLLCPMRIRGFYPISIFWPEKNLGSFLLLFYVSLVLDVFLVVAVAHATDLGKT